MYLHLFFIDSPIFNSEFILFVEKHFGIKNHCFVFAHSNSYQLVENTCNVYYDPSITTLTGSLKYIKKKKYSHIFLHSLYPKMLYLVPKKLLKKVSWCSWGHDLESIKKTPLGIKQEIKHEIIISKIMGMHSFIAGFKGDFLVVSNIGRDIKLFNAIYPMGYKLPAFPRANTNLHKPLNVMIGHSAFPYLQHKKYIELLAPYSKLINLCLVLNYGDKLYAEEIKQVVMEKSFENYVIYEKFMNKDEYVNLINQMDYCVFDFEKQAAFGNILLCLYLKKNIYLSPSGIMYKTLIEEKLNVKPCSSLLEDISNTNNLFTSDELIKNRSWAENYLREENIANQWKNVFSHII